MPNVLPSQGKANSDAIRPRSIQPPLTASNRAAGAAGFKVVAIGASAGGLAACTKLLQALPVPTGMAFILVQHLDPTHKSLLVDLLTEHTALAVVQAVAGMPVEPERLHVIPPGSYLSVSAGALRLSPPEMRDGAPHGARFPFDVFLHSMAGEYGRRAACVILSGTGSDGSAGLRAVKEGGGLVVAQDPDEAGYDGMPRSAIATGLVDAVLPVAGIPEALAADWASHEQSAVPRSEDDASPAAVPSPVRSAGAARPDPLSGIIELLHARTKHDFAPYKRGTLERRIGRRMGMAIPGSSDVGRYLDLLRSDEGELGLLAKDLLIHVTSFFRDPAVFDAMAGTVIPALLRDRVPGEPLRIWVAGCSTGEEAYSLVILFREAMAAAPYDKGPDIKLQVFASDVDPDAVAMAREGLYPATIAADVSARRLAQFFTEEDGHGYRVNPDIRASVVFMVQDLLTDPPFSRLDLVSCRNLMIYLGPDAQARAMALFHFALKEGGTLLLGTAETVGEGDGRFEPIHESARLYRHVGRKRPGDLTFAATATDRLRASHLGRAAVPSRQAVLAELCRQAVLDAHAPAAVLCNARHECLYSLGPTDRYLRLAPGHATTDLPAMAREPLRTRLRAALAKAAQAGTRVTVPGGSMMRDGSPIPFSIDVQPLSSEGETLLLACFVDRPLRPPRVMAQDASRVAELERELEAVRADLDAACRTIETSGEEQRAVNEEALSVNEEYQSTNEELLTSKQELQSLNEELTALNNQLQETLERQRSTSNDLQNILYSTDVATLFLDRDLGIRFFTPATRALFNVIPGDVGRPLADLHSLAADTALPTDARAVLRGLGPIEREVETPGGFWFRRRILPYRTHEGGVEGVVITFSNITRRKQEAAALEEAKQGAEAANRAKSRFLAAASHDLRQPLQTLALLQGLLARAVEGGKAAGLLQRQDETLGAMAGMLDTLLDLSQIEAGVVQAEPGDCRIGGLLDRLRDEFTYHAQAKGLALRVMPCRAVVRTDPRLLEQMLRNLLSNALKYTERGRVLLGCRRTRDSLRIEVWDTGIGIPDGELQAVFDEHHQIGNEARERARGLGLGLSIVQRLSALLGHRVRVRSRPGKGSVFTIGVTLVPDVQSPDADGGNADFPFGARAAGSGSGNGAVLVIEDDPDMRDLLRLLLREEGYAVAVAPDGPAALDMAARGAVRPDLVLADHNLPGGMTGLQAAGRLRGVLPGVPVIILTGDTSAGTLHDIAQQDCVQMSKPVRPADLLRAVQDLLPGPPMPARRVKGATAQADSPVVFVVDDDGNVRAMLRTVLEQDGYLVEDYPDGEAFLAAYRPGREGCLLVDAAMPGMDGLEVLQRLNAAGHRLPAIVVTGSGDVTMAVGAMKAGALDFIEKPVSMPDLLAGVGRALNQSRAAEERSAWQRAAAGSIAGLTPRQRDVMAMMLAGHPSKNIAADLGISQRTVENHRASIMRKTGVKSLPALARLALAAASADGDGPGEPAMPGGAASL